MGLLNKIKNALFEEEEIDDQSNEEEVIAKQIETVKEETPVINNYEEVEEEVEETVYQEEPVYQKQESPIIFDVEDFIEEEPYQEPVKEEVSKEEPVLYGGYEIKDYEKMNEKDRFKPSPIISPVYGILDKASASKIDDTNYDRKSIDRLFVDEKKKTLDFDTVRQKAFGYKETPKASETQKNEDIIDLFTDEEPSLLYEMQQDDRPGIEKISIGDAEEYFEDLGLEYNVDYTDLAKEKMTRTKRNKDLTDVINEEIKETKQIEKELFSYKPIKEEVYETEAEEKNLYDLIDMMYEGK